MVWILRPGKGRFSNGKESAMHRLAATTVAIGIIFLAGSLFLRPFLSRPALAASDGTITGRVVLVGDMPRPKKIKVTKDNEKCGIEKLAEDLVVSSDRGIKNAVVGLPGLKGKMVKPHKNPVIDQKGCVFDPHVLVVPAGATVDILNNDGVLHNFHTYSVKNAPVNKAQPRFKKKMSETFSQPETFEVNCDAHSWMEGWIVVADHPATTTDASGMFKLTGVPPGNHALEIWHETLGKMTKQVTVAEGEETEVRIELRRK